MWCHFILLMPALALPIFFILPLQAALPAYLSLLLLSGFVYIVVFKAMRLPVRTGREGMIGGRGEVVVDLDPEGVIRYRNELWSAVSSERLVKGEEVVIVGIDHLRAIVQRPPKI